jgi:hypothetical protein
LFVKPVWGISSSQNTQKACVVQMIITQGMIKLEKVADPEVATFLFTHVTGKRIDLSRIDKLLHEDPNFPAHINQKAQ